jgi:hypothetical protein
MGGLDTFLALRSKVAPCQMGIAANNENATAIDLISSFSDFSDSPRLVLSQLQRFIAGL